MAGWLMLLFIMVTLYDAQFPIYDTFIGRTTTDAIATTRLRQGRAEQLLPQPASGRPAQPAVPLLVLRGRDNGRAGWVVDGLQTSPFIIWLAGSVAYLINQGIGCIQIMLINNRRLHPEFHVGKINIGPASTRDAVSVGGGRPLAVRGRSGRDHPALAGGRLDAITREAGGW